MARPRSFDPDVALDSAVTLFSEHGFEGTSAAMLVAAMGIGRQSLYDSFGDKWQLYRSALRRYANAEVKEHLAALKSGPRAIDGLRAMIDRVVARAHMPCLGVHSTSEFGTSRRDLAEIKDAAGRVLTAAIGARVREAQAEGDIAGDLDPEGVATFMTASFTGIRLAARGGVDARQLAMLGEMAMRALR